MQRAALDRLRGLLERQRQALLSVGDVEIEAASDGEVVNKPDDDAAPLTEMNQVIASNRNRERSERLQQIDLALERMRDDPDTFGLCEACDEPIAMRRLELMPWARLCIECQAEQEDETRPGARRHVTDYR